MAYFDSNDPNSDLFLRALEWKMLVKFIAICKILHHFGIFCAHLDLLSQETSGNPV
jgi:hypothetical protein